MVINEAIIDLMIKVYPEEEYIYALNNVISYLESYDIEDLVILWFLYKLRNQDELQ